MMNGKLISTVLILLAILSVDIFAQRKSRDGKSEEIEKFATLRSKELSKEEKLKIVRNLAKAIVIPEVSGVVSSLKLSPKNPSIPGKGDLVFMYPTAVIPSLDIATFSESSQNIGSWLTCYFKPGIKGKYLVDVMVKSQYDENIKYNARIDWSLENIKLSSTIPNSVGHFTFIYEAKSVDREIPIEISADKTWGFYGLEISKIN